jgi:hypothetical protein
MEFRKNAGIDKKDFATIEHLLRRGQRQLEIYESDNVHNIFRWMMREYSDNTYGFAAGSNSHGFRQQFHANEMSRISREHKEMMMGNKIWTKRFRILI